MSIDSGQSWNNTVRQPLNAGMMLFAFQFVLDGSLHRTTSFMAQNHEQGSSQVGAAYWILPMISDEITFPATRTMKSSPKFASKINSGGTR
jgi:hypothetical protein